MTIHPFTGTGLFCEVCMMSYSHHIDRERSLKFKEDALDRFEEDRASDLERARQIAVEIAKEQGSVSADDVREVFTRRHGNRWGNWAGSIFRDSRFRCRGWTTSGVVARHAGAIRVWELVA